MVDRDLPVAQHEPRDVGSMIIAAGVVLVTGTAVALALLILWLFPSSIANRTLDLPQYPDPQLQTNPVQDMAAFHRKNLQWLNSTGWVDKAHGIAHIPIADAMREVAKEGIVGWPAPPERRP